MGVREADIEDLCQEVFIKLWEAIWRETFDPQKQIDGRRARLRGYVRKVVRSVCIDHTHRRDRPRVMGWLAKIVPFDEAAGVLLGLYGHGVPRAAFEVEAQHLLERFFSEEGLLDRATAERLATECVHELWKRITSLREKCATSQQEQPSQEERRKLQECLKDVYSRTLRTVNIEELLPGSLDMVAALERMPEESQPLLEKALEILARENPVGAQAVRLKMQGLSRTQITQLLRLEISKEATSMRIDRAQKKLRSIIDGLCGDEGLSGQ